MTCDTQLVLSGMVLIVIGWIILVFGRLRSNGKSYFLPPNLYFALFNREMEERYKRAPLKWARGFIGTGAFLSLGVISYELFTRQF